MIHDNGPTPNPTPPPVVVVSFGYRHRGRRPELADLGLTLPPGAFIYVRDVREELRNPPTDAPHLVELTGAHPDVRAHVLTTPGAVELIEALAAAMVDRDPGGSVLMIGCGGGRHRSYVVAEETAVSLRDRGVPVAVVHADAHRPVVTPAPASAPPAPGTTWVRGAGGEFRAVRLYRAPVGDL